MPRLFPRIDAVEVGGQGCEINIILMRRTEYPLSARIGQGVAGVSMKRFSPAVNALRQGRQRQELPPRPSKRPVGL